MVKTEIDPRIAHRISEPLPGVTYTFNPNGGAYVRDTGREHMYFSRIRSIGRDVGYMELEGAELYEYQARFRKLIPQGEAA